jgi:hypothetical protein
VEQSKAEGSVKHQTYLVDPIIRISPVRVVPHIEGAPGINEPVLLGLLVDEILPADGVRY